MVTLRLNREYTFEILEDTSVTFYFKLKEDLDFSKIRKLIKSKFKETPKEKDVDEETQEAYITSILKQCLVSWKGFVDESGNVLEVFKDGVINEYYRDIVWDFIRDYVPKRPEGLPEGEKFDDTPLMIRILTAYSGESGKN